jgi:AraC family transcriptional regulator, ethanolamine operon transcriptional activator
MSISTISESQPHVAPLVFTRQFDDIDVWAQAIKHLNVTGNQLTSGQFVGRVNFADLGSLKFTDVTYNQAMRIKGLKNPHLQAFTITLQGDQTQILSHGCPIKKHDLFGFDPTREIDITAGKDAHIVVANVNLTVFQSLAEQMGYYDLGQKFFQQNSLHFHPASFRHLRAYYQQVSQMFIHQPSLLMESQAQSHIVENFLPLLIDTIGAGIRQKKPIIKTLRRYSLVKKAEEIAQSYIDKPLTLKQLCDALETSSSALAYGFQDIFGMSPMAYLKIQRLNGVRRALKNAKPDTTTVMQLAHHWGFWSAGHFARDYQEMFSELPSKTLQKIF